MVCKISNSYKFTSLTVGHDICLTFVFNPGQLCREPVRSVPRITRRLHSTVASSTGDCAWSVYWPRQTGGRRVNDSVGPGSGFEKSCDNRLGPDRRFIRRDRRLRRPTVKLQLNGSSTRYLRRHGHRPFTNASHPPKFMPSIFANGR